MGSNQESNETTSLLSAINEKNVEKKSEDISTVTSHHAVLETGGKDATKTADKSQEESEFVVKHYTHQENWVLPDYILYPPQDTDNLQKPDKQTAGTDAPPDGFNVYSNKKTLTQGMMDIALFSANISQLRSMLDQILYNEPTVYAYIFLFLLITSILLQVGVGLLLLLSTRYNINNFEERRMAYENGNYVVAGIFLISLVNVFISAFGTPDDKCNSKAFGSLSR